MTVEEIREGENLTLIPNGNIDVHTSDEFTQTILKSFQKAKVIVVDMKEVSYVSSAGLRAFILGQKTANSKGAQLSLINVQDMVKDIFRTTGFDKLLKYSCKAPDTFPGFKKTHLKLIHYKTHHGNVIILGSVA